MPTVRLHRFAGIANRLQSDDARKQPPDPRDRGGRMFVDALVNGAVTDDGKVVPLSGAQTAATGTQWGAVVSTPAGLIAHDKGAGTLVLNPEGDSPTILVSGLSTSRNVSFAILAGRTYWTNGVTSGMVTAAGAADVWSLPTCPVPTLGSTTGSLAAGKYLVMGAWLTADGREHGSAGFGTATLSATGAVTVNFGVPPTGASHVRIYASIKVNSPDVGFVADVAVGSLPYTLATLPTNVIKPVAQYLGPVPACDRLWAFRDTLFAASGVEVYPSFIGGHVFRYGAGGDAFQAPGTVLGGAGLNTGYYLLTADALYWSDADGRLTLALRAAFAAGAGVAPTKLLGMVREADGDCALFWSDHGLVVGLEGGRVLAPNWDSIVSSVAGAEVNIHVWGDRLAALVN